MLTDAHCKKASCSPTAQRERLANSDGALSGSLPHGVKPLVIEAQLARAVKDANGRAYNRTRYLAHRAR